MLLGVFLGHILGVTFCVLGGAAGSFGFRGVRGHLLSVGNPHVVAAPEGVLLANMRALWSPNRVANPAEHTKSNTALGHPK